jgi:hypothetical protein
MYYKIFEESVSDSFSTRKVTVKHKQKARKYELAHDEINHMYIDTS